MLGMTTNSNCFFNFFDRCVEEITKLLMMKKTTTMPLVVVQVTSWDTYWFLLLA